jgi:hypothetical protein
VGLIAWNANDAISSRGGTWRSLRLAKVWCQMVGFVFMRLAEMWLHSPWRCFHITLFDKGNNSVLSVRSVKYTVTNCITVKFLSNLTGHRLRLFWDWINIDHLNVRKWERRIITCVSTIHLSETSYEDANRIKLAKEILCEYAEWIHLSSDGERFRAVVNTLKKFLVP